MFHFCFQLLIPLFCGVFAFNVFAEGEAKKPAEGEATKVAPKGKKRNIELSWEEIPGALKYELKVKRLDKSKSKDMYFVTKKSTWSGNINPGEYEMQLRTYDARGIAGEWSESTSFWAKAPGVVLTKPRNQAELLGRNQKEDVVLFGWEAIPGIPKYHFHLRDLEDGTDKVITTDKNQISVKLPVAHTFDWQVVAIQSDEVVGEIAENPFVFTMYGPELEPIKLIDPLSDILRVIRFKKPAFTDHFTAKIEFQNGSKWESKFEDKNLKTPEIDFNVDWLPGNYRLTLQAFSHRRKPSPVFTQEFAVGGGIRKTLPQKIVQN